MVAPAVPTPWLRVVAVTPIEIPAPAIEGTVSEDTTRSGGTLGVALATLEDGPSPDVFTPRTT
jgi:hypothetical protein